ncbi:dienelactone hydrolase family protein [Zavarzinia sp. CC-PAN008]|uniref:dienelactone hydrolase family protein n=1 Tax=Zavarzinia sp. CC-PAN008 TaxID=3243332 RepID=UPI003F7432ED
MIEHQLEIATADGAMDTFICHPERDGPHPVILFLMDAPGIREELRDMARRLGTAGYYVMLPNLYYRQGVTELGTFIGPGSEAVREKMFGLMGTLSISVLKRDIDSLIAHADGDAAAAADRVGAVGYCMSGQYAMTAAAHRPDRVRAAASIYGVRLITEAADSPHRAVANSPAELYVAWAETDHYAPIEELQPFADALKQAGVKAEVELYRGVEHGFAFPQRPAYDKPAAERHWERLFALFGRNLG